MAMQGSLEKEKRQIKKDRRTTNKNRKLRVTIKKESNRKENRRRFRK